MHWMSGKWDRDSIELVLCAFFFFSFRINFSFDVLAFFYHIFVLFASQCCCCCCWYLVHDFRLVSIALIQKASASEHVWIQYDYKQQQQQKTFFVLYVFVWNEINAFFQFFFSLHRTPIRIFDFNVSMVSISKTVFFLKIFAENKSEIKSLIQSLIKVLRCNQWDIGL